MTNKSPSLLFYPGDWLRNANLRRCSLAERGAWIEVMCLMHDADTYGILHWPLREIAAAAAVPVKALQALADKGVIKGTDSGMCEAYAFTPKTNRKDNPPVLLLAEQSGPVWYSSRMLRDDYIRKVRQDAANNKVPHFAKQSAEQNEGGVASKSRANGLQSVAKAKAKATLAGEGLPTELSNPTGEGEF